MSVDYTTTAFLLAIREQNMLPSAGRTFTDSLILNTANREMQNYLVPMLLRLGEEYLVAETDTTTTAGEDTYAIPSRSVGVKTRDVQLQFNGTTGAFVSIPRIPPERAPFVAANNNPGVPARYYVENYSVVLAPAPSGALPLRIKWYRRPSNLVTTGYSTITSISGSSSPYTVTVASTTGMATGLFDLVGVEPPFDTPLDDITGTVVNGTTLSLTLTAAQAAAFSSTYAGNYYIAQAGTSPVAQIPVECAPLLEQRTAARLLQSVRDPGVKLALQECAATEVRIRDMLAPRTAGLPRKAGNPYGPGRRGWGAFGGWGGWGGPG